MVLANSVPAVQDRSAIAQGTGGSLGPTAAAVRGTLTADATNGSLASAGVLTTGEAKGL